MEELLLVDVEVLSLLAGVVIMGGVATALWAGRRRATLSARPKGEGRSMPMPWGGAFALGLLAMVSGPVWASSDIAGVPFPGLHFVSFLGLGTIFAGLIWAGGRSGADWHAGYRWVISGFWLLFLRSTIELGAAGGMFRNAGDVLVETVGLTCGACGLIAIAVGFAKWLPEIAELVRTREKLESRRAELEGEVLARMSELEAEIEVRRQAERMAASASLAKSKFLANMSHELRTPLNAIIGFSDMLMGPAADRLPVETIREFGKDVNHAGRHLLELVNDVLDLAKIEAGKMEVIVEQVSLKEEIDICLRILSGKAAERDIAVAAAAEASDIVLGDARAIRQVLLNLVSNSLKFTAPGGRVTVSTKREGDSLSVMVADNGCGIPEEKIERVFEAFEQADNSYARRGEGTGLGLALCRQLARLMHGEVSLQSRPGVGTTACMTLPAACASDAFRNAA